MSNSTTKNPTPASSITRQPTANRSDLPMSLQRQSSRSPRGSPSPRRNVSGLDQSLRSPHIDPSISANSPTKQFISKPPAAMRSVPSSGRGSVDLDDEIRAKQATLVEDLGTQLAASERALDTAEKHVSVLESRIEDLVREQARMEEEAAEHQSQLESVEKALKDVKRRERDMEQVYEAERAAMIREKDNATTREDELLMVIQRLKDSLAQRELRNVNENEASQNVNSPSSTLEYHFAPPSTIQRSNSHSNSKLLLQKDKVIESLRLELAEAQIKLVESDYEGGGKTEELEKMLMEQRIVNARLVEDNESFQLLLSEKTLNGDFSKINIIAASSTTADEKSISPVRGQSSLADELQSVSSAENDTVRRLEADLRSQKDANKALTLYINKIIERVLNHKDFETILDKSSINQTNPNNTVNGTASSQDKALPPPPPGDDLMAGQSFLQRARSVATTAAMRPKPRPQSFMPFAPPAPAASISESSFASPLSRSQSVRAVPINGHRRSNSEYVSVHPSGTDQLHRAAALPGGNHLGRASSSISPPLSSSNNSSHQNSSRTISVGNARRPGSSSNSDETSTFSSVTSSSFAAGNSVPTSAPSIGGSKLRPLRLVQENADVQAEAAATEAELRKAKRGSWMGWFGRGKEESGPIFEGQETIEET